MEKEKVFYDVAIGSLLTDHFRRLLLAPSGSCLKVGDIVGTMRGEYRVMFSDSYVSDDSELITALRVALNMEPEKVIKRIVEERFEWEDSSDDTDF